MYRKLTLKDIKILHPGAQMERAVLEKYSSIEEFAEAIGMKADSVNIYFHSRPYGTGKFRNKLMLLLDIDYNDIVLTDIGQISKYITEIWENIAEYDAEEDIEVLNKIKDLCMKYNTKELSRVYRLISKHYFYIHKEHVALEYIDMAIDKISEPINYNLLVTYYTDIFHLCYYTGDTTIAKKAYRKSEMILCGAKLEDKATLFYYYYRLGVLFTQSESEHARELFNKSLVYAQYDYQRGAATANIGNTYHYKNKDVEAIKYYKKTLQLYNPEDSCKLSTVYDNLAHSYYASGDIENAKECNSKSLILLDEKDKDLYYTYLNTYVKINYRSENFKAIESLLVYLKTSFNLMYNKSYIIESLYEIIELASLDNNCLALYQIMDTITDFVNKHSDGSISFTDETRTKLVNCLGEAQLSVSRIKRRERN